jgi:hypothetical protein
MGSFTGSKAAGLEADHSPSSSAEVKNVEVIPPLPHTSSWHSGFLIKHRDVTFFFYVVKI